MHKKQSFIHKMRPSRTTQEKIRIIVCSTGLIGNGWMKKKMGGHSHTKCTNTHTQKWSQCVMWKFSTTPKKENFQSFCVQKTFTCMCACGCVCVEASSAAFAFSQKYFATPQNKFFSYIFRGVSNSVGFLLCLPASASCPLKVHQKCSLHRALDASRHIPSSRRVLIKKK